MNQAEAIAALRAAGATEVRVRPNGTVIAVWFEDPGYSESLAICKRLTQASEGSGTDARGAAE